MPLQECDFIIFGISNTYTVSVNNDLVSELLYTGFRNQKCNIAIVFHHLSGDSIDWLQAQFDILGHS